MSVEHTVLSNGMTVVTHAMPHLESAALGVWVRSGSRNETRRQHGISHLLEHMAFKGTRNRSARAIAEEIEAVGGDLNAATSVENTSYFARVLKDDVPLALDILSDILLNARFDADELHREQHVILQEIGATLDNPEDLVFDAFQEAAFNNQPIGRTILGTAETVQGFSTDDLRQFLTAQYKPADMVVSAAGAVDHDEFVRQTEKAFGGLTEPDKPIIEHEKAAYTGGQFFQPKDLMEAHILLGFEGHSYKDDRFYATQLLASVLGGGMASRLFQEVRETRGLCYSIYSFHWGFSDTGLFGIHAATGREDIPELVPVVLDEMLKACDGISEAEVSRARAQVRASLLMSLESPSSRAAQIARQMLVFGRVIDLNELVAKIDAITPADLRDLGGSLFTNRPPTLASIGPIDGVESVLSTEAISGHLKRA
uniref:M16 family metallopeptidase n=1 Tax=Pararhizobium sp. IMCC3301 TaxID=3067904 RepID=UPI0027418886|nr:pitrilysin family protein [Pararhizobium sp. IMCC3301]